MRAGQGRTKRKGELQRGAEAGARPGDAGRLRKGWYMSLFLAHRYASDNDTTSTCRSTRRRDREHREGPGGCQRGDVLRSGRGFHAERRGPAPEPRVDRGLRQTGRANLKIVVLTQERRLARVATLRRVVRKPRNHPPRRPRHAPAGCVHSQSHVDPSARPFTDGP